MTIAHAEFWQIWYMRIQVQLPLEGKSVGFWWPIFNILLCYHRAQGLILSTFNYLSTFSCLINVQPCCRIYTALYGRKSDPGAKVIPKPNWVCKTAKLIPKLAKLIPLWKHGTDQSWSVKLIRLSFWYRLDSSSFLAILHWDFTGVTTVERKISS